MRTQLIAASAAVLLCASVNTIATIAQTQHPHQQQTGATAMSPELAGTWKSAPDEMKLTTAFDESVWGANAKSVRTVELQVNPSGEGALKVTRRVVDARGRTVPASTSIEEAQIAIGGSRKSVSTRIEHDVKVVSAVRTYPDDPGHKWNLDGLRVEIVTFEDGDRNTLEVRFDTPEGRGSFWETLRREGRSAPARRVTDRGRSTTRRG